jgi:peptide-methionine (R)-S-oxide reductase
MTDALVRSASGFDLTPPSPEAKQRLEAGLSAEEREVLLRHGTEAPFCGGLLGEKADGVYSCRLCGLPLFKAQTKFDSGTGWPSFYAPIDAAHGKRSAATLSGVLTDLSLGGGLSSPRA